MRIKSRENALEFRVTGDPLYHRNFKTMILSESEHYRNAVNSCALSNDNNARQFKDIRVSGVGVTEVKALIDMGLKMPTEEWDESLAW